MEVLRLRKATETPGETMWQTGKVGAFMAVLMFVVWPAIVREYERAIMHRPFVSATLEIVHGDPYPIIMYDADAVTNVVGEWTSVIYSAQGWRITDRRGPGRYSAKPDEPRPWTWQNFFQTEGHAPAPAVPHFPFYICVTYGVATYNGVPDESETPSCSNVFDPNEVAQ